MSVSFPGESAEYRAARDRLLEMEIDLRRRTEAVAAARRELPPGGAVPEDYVFASERDDGEPTDVRLSELFAAGRDSLAIYSFMFPRDPEDERPGPAAEHETGRLPLAEGPCPSCVALLDQLDGAIEHAGQHVNFAVVAKAPLPRVLTFTNGAGDAFACSHRPATHITVTTTPRPRTARSARCSTCFTATAVGSATSGDRSSSTRPGTRARIPGTSGLSSRSGTCST